MFDEVCETFLSDEDQMKIILEMTKVIETCTYSINRSLDLGQVGTAVDFASKLIEVLKTSQLTPRNYYTTYHAVSTTLLQISVSIRDEDKFPNYLISELYETVQYQSGCMQRLYLMITIAPELARRKIIRVVDLLDDLSDMTRAAQDPIRALFMRHYLLSIFKQYLPDTSASDTEKSLNFLLNNFAQMNRMWVRIEDMMASDSRKDQRVEFSVLIGTNIQRISSLNGISIDNYSTIILPFLAKHVELCEDALSQDFILRSIIHAFPEEFHISTIDQLFTVFGKVEQGVKILAIVNQLLERFLQYVGQLVDTQKSSAVFVTIAKNIEELFSTEGHLGLTDKFETLQRLLKFALKINSNDVKNVKNLMKFTDFHIDLAIGDESLSIPEASEQLRVFLEVPLSILCSAQLLYKIEYLPTLIRRLRTEDKLLVAEVICQMFIRSQTSIISIEELNFYISVSGSLVRESSGSSSFFSVLHLIQGETQEKTFLLIQELCNLLADMTEDAAERFVLPLGMVLIKTYYSSTERPLQLQILKYLYGFCETNLSSFPYNVMVLCLEIAKASLHISKIDIYLEFLKMVLENISLLTKPNCRARMITYIIATILNSPQQAIDYYPLVCQLAEETSSQIKQVTTVVFSSMLFWRKDAIIQDSNQVQSRLNKALNLAVLGEDKGLSLNCLYIVLDMTVYCLENSIPISDKWVNQLLLVISDRHREILKTGNKLESVMSSSVKQFYINLARYIKDNDLLNDESEDEEEED